MIRLSKRLQVVANHVQTGGVVADIGCDHALTSMYLIEQHLAEHVIAMDIREGPLQRAKENIISHHMEADIETRLSDGASKLVPGEADVLLMSGMGGMLICKILSDALDVLKTVKELVLSPQSDQEEVRRFLLNHDFKIDKEAMLQEQGKYYVIIHSIPGKQKFARKEEYQYGKFLIESRDACLADFLDKEEKRVKRVLQNLEGTDLSETARLRKECLQEELYGILDVKKQMYMKERRNGGGYDSIKC